MNQTENIGKSTIIVRDSDTSLSVIDRTGRQKISRGIKELKTPLTAWI